MRGSELLEKMELADPAFVEAAAEVPHRSRTRWLKWAVLAACFCAVICFSVSRIFPLGTGSSICHQVTLGGNDLVYYATRSGTYAYAPGTGEHTKLVSFSGMLQTPSGLFLMDQTSGAIFSVSGTELLPLGNIEPHCILMDVIGQTAYYRTYESEPDRYTFYQKALDTGAVTQVMTTSGELTQAQAIRDGKLYYDCYENNSTSVKCLDLSTCNVTTLLTLAPADGEEIESVFFFDELMVIKSDLGLYSMRFGDSTAAFLTAAVPITGALDLYDGRLYYETLVPNSSGDRSGDEFLIALDLSTGSQEIIRNMSNGDGTVNTYTEIVVCRDGYYFTDPSATVGGLYYYDNATGLNTRISK